MKIVLREKRLGKFVGLRNRWVGVSSHALDFKSGVNAIGHAVRHRLNGMELVHIFPDSQYNFSVPIGDF